MKKNIFWVIIILAVLVRVVYFFQIKDHFLFKQPILDAKYYHTWALEIAHGDWLGKSRGVFMMSPGYSYFLAVIYRIFGDHIPLVVLLQFFLGLLTGVMVFKIGEKLFSRTAGILGMIFCLFYSVSIFYESTLLKTTLINCLNISGLYLLLTGGIYGYIISGVLFGFSVHLRPNVMMLLPLVVIYLFKEKKFKQVFIFSIGVFLILLPVGLRNLKVGGEFVFSTAHGGMNFYTGNSSFCKGPYTPLPFARTDPEVEQSDFMREANLRSGKTLTSAESSSFWYRESFRYIGTHTYDWLELLSKKTLIFFNSYEPPINLDYYFFKNEYKSILSFPMFGYGIILPLAIIGLIFSPLNFLTLSYLFVYFISGAIFFVVSEYRFPMVPVLCVYAGFSLEYIYKLYKKAPPLKFFTAAFMLIFLFWLVNSDIYTDIFGFPNYKRANLANSYFGLGVTYEDQGLINQAIESYKKAISIMPQTGPMVNLANIYEQQNNLEEAQKLDEATIKNNPDSGEAFNNLGSVLFRKGNYAGAAICFKKAIILNPYIDQAKKNLAKVEEVIKNNKR